MVRMRRGRYRPCSFSSFRIWDSELLRGLQVSSWSGTKELAALSSYEVINVIFQAGSEHMKIGPAFSFSVARRSSQRRITSQLSRMIMQVLTLSRDSLRGGTSCYTRITRIGKTKQQSSSPHGHGASKRDQTRDERRDRKVPTVLTLSRP